MKLRTLQNNTPITEGKTMKPIAFLSLLAAIFLVSCSATRHGATVYDDVYYSPSDPVVHVKEVVVTKEIVVEETLPQIQQPYNNDEAGYYMEDEGTYYAETSGSEDGTIFNNYYFYGDYYDYSYSSRIRRFHRPIGYSYYHDYYTNMYWYNYDPHYWGTSIYIGYGFYPASFYSYRWGWPSYSYWSYWYNPYYMYGMGYPHYYYGYGSYWAGYRHGYWDGYYGGSYYEGWYKNSYDKNSYYYGPRTGFAGNTGGSGPAGTGRPASFGEKYEEALAAENQNREMGQAGRGSRTVPTGDEPTIRSEAAVGGRAAGTTPGGQSRESLQESDRTGTRDAGRLQEDQRPVATPSEGRQGYERVSSERSDQNQRAVAPNQRTYQYSPPASREAGYERPDAQRQQAQPAQRQPQPYSSPRYTKPKTSEEFTSPAFRSPRETTRPAENAAPQQQATPSQQRPVQPQAVPGSQRQSTPQASPNREQPSQPRYTPPSRPSDTRQSAPPSRSVSPPPSRSSSPSYTPPRSSSPAPSRSSSPSVSSPSRSSSPAPSRSSSPSVSSPSRSSGGGSSSGSSSGGSSSGSSSRGSSSGSSSGRGGR